MRCVRRQLIGNVLDDVSPAPIPQNCLFQWREDHLGLRGFDSQCSSHQTHGVVMIVLIFVSFDAE